MAYKRISPVPVVEGGTSIISATAYAVLCGGTTTTSAFQSVAGLGSSGDVLTSNGAAALPTFQAGGGGGGGVTSITGDIGTAQTGALTLTGGVSGAIFDSTTSSITETFNFLNFNATPSATDAQITILGNTVVSFYGNAGLSDHNIFLGNNSGNFTIGPATSNNTGIGFNTLAGLTGMSVVGNTAVGESALTTLSTGVNNTSIGITSLLSLDTGSRNTAIGYNAGTAYTTNESDNLCINDTGVIGDSATLRIQTTNTASTSPLVATFIGGISGIVVTGTAVLVSSDDQLGIAVSSRKYKDNIEDMGNKSSDILKLRPVTFNYNVGVDESQQTGLIAEEVNEIMPSLVVYDKSGEPQTVKYHELPALLLNELKKALKRIDHLEQQLSKLLM